jgi:2-oxoacid dehydrogenase/acyltransferase catalytic subunit
MEIESAGWQANSSVGDTQAYPRDEHCQSAVGADCITNMAGFNLRQAQPTGGATRAALSLTFDHRVVTGGEAARFMVALKSDRERTS